MGTTQREIKFRVWHKSREKMYRPDAFGFSSDSENELYGVSIGPHIHTSSSFEIMQFTGLKDSKGKEIYEGDIVEICNPYSERLVAEVVWSKSEPLYVWAAGETWIVRLKDGSQASLWAYCEERSGFEVDVVGNIYENAERLERLRK